MSIHNTDLENITYKDCKKFIPPITSGKVVKVYDGDTITIANYLHPTLKDTIYRFSVRIKNIDCPEMRTKNTEEKEMAIICRDILSKHIFGKMVKLDNLDVDKYGRILADVYYDETNISEFLISKNLAVLYDGKIKNVIDWKKLYEK
jgi:endonuclease YncB( thermonuclease family)